MFERILSRKDRSSKGRASILDANKHPHNRKNYSHRRTFDLVKIKCSCGHLKGFDKTLQKVVSGVFCCKCGAKQ